MFGVQEDAKPDVESAVPTTPIDLRPGTITLITGASGSGKTTLLRELRSKSRARAWLDVATIKLPDIPVVDCFNSDELVEVLMTLGRVGLGEVWTYLRKPSQLSEGQRWRLRLALALWRLRDNSGVLLADEFCAVLDRVTAKVVARCLRKTIDANPNIAAVLASPHDDLEAALRPDVIIRCDFGSIHVQSI
jgi:ABC-type ATPase with predicted acetyltransferase domain